MAESKREAASKRRQRGLDKLQQFLEQPEKERGLNPLDLLTKLPPEQRRVVNWLARRKRATPAELAEGLAKEGFDVSAVLHQLRDAGYVQESFIDNQLAYRVRFGAAQSASHKGLPQDIWVRIDLNKVGFLRQMPLFAQLAEGDLRAIADKMELRRLERGDVILWQGQAAESVYFIKSGVVGITFVSADMQNVQFLAHLKQGDMLGEYSLLAEQELAAASATATALSNVELLVISHADFLELLDQHKSLSLGMARMLVERLLDMNPKRSQDDTRLSLVFGIGARVGRTAVGSALALMLGRDKQAVYTEYPTAHHLQALVETAQETAEEFLPTGAGYDIAIPTIPPGLPSGLRTALLFEKLNERYSRMVIGLPGRIDNAIIYLLERADQLVFVSDPTAEGLAEKQALHHDLRTYIRPEKTTVFHVVNRPLPEHAKLPTPHGVDYDLPYLQAEYNPRVHGLAELPPALAAVAGGLADRLGRTNQISVYIPTTIDIDQTVDTRPFVERTLAVLGQLFGGATSSEAQGVWNSENAGLVGETVYIVRSYATRSALDMHLPLVLSHVEQLKQELKQEAMAVEVNQKLLLI